MCGSYIVSPRLQRLLPRTVTKCFRSFFESALYFAFATEVAALVILLQRDFADITSDFGAVDAQIAWVVCILAVLPLWYPLFFLREEAMLCHHGTQLIEGEVEPGEMFIMMREEKNTSKREQRQRHWLYSLVVVLFFYPFLTQCVHYFAPSDLRNQAGKSGPENFATVSKVCHGDKNQALSSEETDILKSFGLFGSLIVLFPALVGAFIVFLPTKWHNRLKKIHVESEKIMELNNRSTRPTQLSGWKCFLFLMIPIIAESGLLWGLFRLRKVNRGLAESIGITYEDDQWGFGQIVALFVFLPVFFTMGFGIWNQDD